MKKRKKYSQKKNVVYKIGIFTLFISIFLVSIGYSAFREDLSVENIVSYVEKIVNIKVSNAVVHSASDSESYANSTSRTNTSFITNVHLNDSTSWVKYQLTVNNIGNEEMGIVDFLDNTLPSNLEYSIDGYNMGDTLCDDNDSSKCTLNSTTTFYLTIKYKNGSSINTPTDYDVNIGLDFAEFHNISYATGICTDCPSRVIDGGDISVTLQNYNVVTVYMSNLLLDESSYSFNQQTGSLSLNNISGDVRIENKSYRRIEYIQSTGTTDKQFINTLYSPNNNTIAIFDGMVISGDTALFGSRTATNTADKFTYQYIGSNKYRANLMMQEVEIDSTYVLGVRHTFRLDFSSAYIDNVVVASYSPGANAVLTSNKNLYLLALNTNNVASNFGSTRLYSFKIYEGDELIKSFIPVLDPDNVPCLYETVGNDFYYNGGSGTFIYDDIVNRSVTINIDTVTSTNTQTQITSGETYSTTFIPKTGNTLPTSVIVTSNGSMLTNGVEYTYNNQTGEFTFPSLNRDIEISVAQITTVDYVFSHGTEYINTGYVPTANTKVVLTHIPMASTYKSWGAYFGTKASSNNTNSFYVSTGAENVSAWVGGVQISNGNYAFTHTVDSIQVITLSASELTIVEDGVTKVTRTNTGTITFNNPGSIYLFARNAGGSANYPIALKIKSFQIYENEELVLDFVPILDDSGRYGFYDTISEEYFYPAGSASLGGSTAT